jgi:hypothetical protein
MTCADQNREAKAEHQLKEKRGVDAAKAIRTTLSMKFRGPKHRGETDPESVGKKNLSSGQYVTDGNLFGYASAVLQCVTV